MSVNADRERAYLTRDIRMAEDSIFRAEQDRQSAEKGFVRAVETVGAARVEAATIRARLTDFEASLCGSCGCFKDDHADADGEDPRPAGTWVCYSCGRDEECPR